MVAFTSIVDALPVLGVGASLSFGVQPDPVALAEHPRGPSFIEYAGAVQHTFLAAPMNALKKLGVPLLYHPSCLNLCGPWKNPADWLDAVDAHVKAAGSPWLAQDVAVCFASETPGYSIQLGYFVPPILTERTLAQAVERVQEVQERVSAPLLLEPAPVTFVAGDMDIFSWLGGLAERTDSGLLIDAGHIVSHQLARGAGLDDFTGSGGLDVMDLDRVIELHIAGGVIEVDDATGKQVYLDAHDLPILPETWQVARTLLERCRNLRAVCVECEGTLAGAVLPMLEQCRQRVEAVTANPALREVVDAELARAG